MVEVVNDTWSPLKCPKHYWSEKNSISYFDCRNGAFYCEHCREEAKTNLCLKKIEDFCRGFWLPKGQDVDVCREKVYKKLEDLRKIDEKLSIRLRGSTEELKALLEDGSFDEDEGYLNKKLKIETDRDTAKEIVKSWKNSDLLKEYLKELVNNSERNIRIKAHVLMEKSKIKVKDEDNFIILGKKFQNDVRYEINLLNTFLNLLNNPTSEETPEEFSDLNYICCRVYITLGYYDPNSEIVDNLVFNHNAEDGDVNKVSVEDMIESASNQEEVFFDTRIGENETHGCTKCIEFYQPVELKISGNYVPNGSYVNSRLIENVLFVHCGTPRMMYAINFNVTDREGCTCRDIIFGNMKFNYVDFGFDRDNEKNLYIFTEKKLYTLDISGIKTNEGFNRIVKSRLKRVKDDDRNNIMINLFVNGNDTSIFGRNVYLYADNTNTVCYYEYSSKNLVKTQVTGVTNIISILKPSSQFSYPMVIKDNFPYTLDIDHPAYLSIKRIKLGKDHGLMKPYDDGFSICILPKGKDITPEKGLFLSSRYWVYDGEYVENVKMLLDGYHSIVHIKEDVYLAYLAKDISSPCSWQFVKIVFNEGESEE